MKRIGIVTYRDAPQLTADDRCLLAPLTQQGYAVVPVIWDAPGIAWEAFDAVLLRSCWDYHLYPDAFLEWIGQLDRLGVAVWNPTPLLRWNIDKTYLRDLAGLGAAVPETGWIKAGAHARLEDVLWEHDLDDVVIKPTISATAWHTWRTSRATATQGQARFAELVRLSDVMVQAFVPEVVSEGEWSFIFFGRQYSHAVLKRATTGDFRVQSDFGGVVHRREPPSALIEHAQALIAHLDPPSLYARVDGVEREGQLLLLELELIEPELFLQLDPAFVQRFVEEIVAVV